MLFKGNGSLMQKAAAIAAIGLCASAFAGPYDSTWKKSGNDIYNNNSGAVGINTTAPTSGYILDVNGKTYLRDNLTLTSGKSISVDHIAEATGSHGVKIDGEIIPDSLTVNGTTFLKGICKHFGSSVSSRWYRSAGDRYGEFFYDGDYFTIQLPTNDPLLIQKSDGTDLHLFNASGAVGINTTAPTSGYILDVNGKTYLRDNLIIAADKSVSIGTTNAPGANGKLLVKGGAVIGYSAAGTNPPDSGLVVRGAVAIGTTNPPANTALAVNGTIRSKEVIVTASGWSDFVFEKSYSLKPLEQVEQYVKKNSHLEGIPSESEVKTGGIAVGEMQAKLLQKLEEVTLYLIEQNKKIELLTHENGELHNKLDKLASH
jgi:hypothetical protein